MAASTEITQSSQNPNTQQQHDEDKTNKSSLSSGDFTNTTKGTKTINRFATSSRLFIMLPATWSIFATFFVCSTADTHHTTECALNSPKKIALILYNGTIAILCIVTILCGILSKHSLTTYANNLCGLQSLTDSNEADPYDFSIRPYTGIVYLCCILYTALISMIDDIFIDVVDLPATTRCIAGGVNLAILVFWKQIKCQTHVMKKRQYYEVKDILQGIEHNINERVKELKHLKSSPFLTNHKTHLAEFVLLCILLFVNNYIGTAVLNWFLSEKGEGAIIITTVFYVTEAIMLAYILFSVHTICLPSIFMDELSSSVHCENIDRMIDWWELRKFYRDCIVKVYFSSLGVLIGSALNVSIVIIVFLFARLIMNRTMDLDNEELGVWMCYIVAITFIMIRNAATYNASRLAHEHMIRKEAMTLQRYAMCSSSASKKSTLSVLGIE